MKSQGAVPSKSWEVVLPEILPAKFSAGTFVYSLLKLSNVECLGKENVPDVESQANPRRRSSS